MILLYANNKDADPPAHPVLLLFAFWKVYGKTCLKLSLKKTPKYVFKTDNRIMQVESGKWSILQYFQPALSYHLSLRPLFCLFLIGHLRQVSLY